MTAPVVDYKNPLAQNDARTGKPSHRWEARWNKWKGQAAIRIDHGTAQLVQQEPGTLVTAEPELGLELQGGDTVRVAGHDVNGHEPGLQGQMAAVHDRACGHRSLLPAGRTFPARPATLQSPAPVMAAGGADKAVGPALGYEMPGAGGFIGKARLEGGAGHRAVVFPEAGQRRTLGEHPANGNRKPNMSSNRVQRDKPFTYIGIDRQYHNIVLRYLDNTHGPGPTFLYDYRCVPPCWSARGISPMPGSGRMEISYDFTQYLLISIVVILLSGVYRWGRKSR